MKPDLLKGEVEVELNGYIKGKLSSGGVELSVDLGVRRTRARRIAAAGSYRPSATDAILTIIGGAGVDSYVFLLNENK